MKLTFLVFVLAATRVIAQSAPSLSIVSVTPANAVIGQSVTLTAQIVPATAVGTVLFLDGTTPLGVGKPNLAGMTQITTIALPAGIHSLTAIYSGNSASAPLRSAATAYTVHANAGTGFATAANYPAGT